MSAATTDLRTLIASSVKVVDVGDREYFIEGTAVIDSKTLTGAGGKITRVYNPDAPRVYPGIRLRGTAPILTGRVDYQGCMAQGGRFNEDKEAHHAVQVDGAIDARCEGRWNVHHHHGDAVTLMTTRFAHDPWTQNFKLTGWNMYEIGRHHVTANAVQVCNMAGLTMGRCDLSPVDIEPPGGSWGARKFTWLDTIISDTGGGATFANKGEGSSDTVQDIYLGGLRCTDRPFYVSVNPTPKPGNSVIRRQRYRIVNCAGVGPTYQPQLVFRHVDGIYIRNVDQPCKTPLIRCIDCTKIDADVPYLAA